MIISENKQKNALIFVEVLIEGKTNLGLPTVF